MFSFLAGVLCGALVGSVTVLLLTPASGQQLREDAVARWEEALKEARTAMEETRQEMEAQFEQMKRGETPPLNQTK
jgi:gas vesicle protein